MTIDYPQLDTGSSISETMRRIFELVERRAPELIRLHRMTERTQVRRPAKRRISISVTGPGFCGGYNDD